MAEANGSLKNFNPTEGLNTAPIARLLYLRIA